MLASRVHLLAQGISVLQYFSCHPELWHHSGSQGKKI
jgi:hypothetical protein